MENINIYRHSYWGIWNKIITYNFHYTHKTMLGDDKVHLHFLIFARLAREQPLLPVCALSYVYRVYQFVGGLYRHSYKGHPMHYTTFIYIYIYIYFKVHAILIIWEGITWQRTCFHSNGCQIVMFENHKTISSFSVQIMCLCWVCPINMYKQYT